MNKQHSDPIIGNSPRPKIQYEKCCLLHQSTHIRWVGTEIWWPRNEFITYFRHISAPLLRSQIEFGQAFTTTD